MSHRKKLPKHYIGKEGSVVRFIVDGFKSLARAWPTPLDIFELIFPILEEEKVQTYLKNPSKSKNEIISIMIHFIADLVKQSRIEEALRSRIDSNYKLVLASIKVAIRESKVSEEVQFSRFLSAIESSERRYSSKDFKTFFHLFRRSSQTKSL